MGKITASGQALALLQQINALAQKVGSLEKQKQPTAEPKPFSYLKTGSLDQKEIPYGLEGENALPDPQKVWDQRGGTPNMEQSVCGPTGSCRAKAAGFDRTSVMIYGKLPGP